MAQWSNRLKELFLDWQFAIQRDGWRSALPRAARELSRLPYYRAEFVVVARDLAEPIPDLQPKISLDFREIAVQDLQWIRQIHRPSEARASARRIERGHRGMIAFHDGQAVGYAWGCNEVDPELERVSLELGPKDMLCVDAYTSEPFRGKGVQTALTLARFRLFRELGFLRALAYIEKGNAPSLAVWGKVGAHTVGHIDFGRIATWRRSRQHWLTEETEDRAEQ